MTILHVIYFMPALVSILWVLTFMVTGRIYRQNVTLWCLIVAVPYFISNAMGTVSEYPVVSVLLSLAMAAAVCVLGLNEYRRNLEPATLEPGTLEPGTLEPGTLEPGTLEPATPSEENADAKEEEMIEKIMKESEENGEVTAAPSATESDDSDNGLDDMELNIDSIRLKRAASMFNALTRLMVEEKIYLNPDLTVADVAERLLVSRSTLSNMINHEYGKTFRSVLNDYRIYYAKQFMLDHPQCTQEVIAIKCGFKDASAFSHKFKDIVGTSPLMWLTSQTKKARKG